MGDLTFDVDRINAVNAALLQRAPPGTDPLAKQCNDLAAKVEDLRKKIVATTKAERLPAKSGFARRPRSSTERWWATKDVRRITTSPGSIP